MRIITNNVNRSRVYENTLQLLGGKEGVLFPTLRDALSFAATLGYREGRKLPLDSKAGKEDIQSTVYNQDDAVDLIFCIGLAHHKSAEILKAENEKECISIFEEYGNGGLALITEWLELYSDVDLEDAIWRGLKSIGFKPPNFEMESPPINVPDF